MNTAFSIRRAAEPDIPELARHRAAMFRDMGVLGERLEGPLREAAVAWLRDAMPRRDYLAWVAEASGDGVIGGAGVQLRPIMPRPPDRGDELELGPEAIVFNVYVAPAWRRRGVADALMRALLDDLRDRGIRRIVLHASAEGRRLYERLGFTATNEMRLTSGPGGDQ